MPDSAAVAARNREKREPGDTISTVLLLSFGEQHSMGHLLILTGRHRGKKLCIPNREIVIGRDAGCDLRLNSELVSRRHCKLCSVADGVRVEDLNSQNGTYVNDVAVKEHALLEPGDHLRIGSTVFQLVDEAVEAAEKQKADDAISEVDIASWLNEPSSKPSQSDQETAVYDIPAEEPAPEEPAPEEPSQQEVFTDPHLQQAAEIIRRHWSG